MSLSVNFTLCLLFVHLISAMIWVGGMFFALFALSPAAALALEPAPRLRLMTITLGNFFRMVAVAVLLILASGFALLGRMDFFSAPLGWKIMTILGLVMAMVFLYIYRVLYASLKENVSEERWAEAGVAMNAIRRLVVMNLCLGIVVVMVAISIKV